MSNQPSVGKAGFGTAPVFLTAICTILGAILFLRFGYAVGNVGFLKVLMMIVIGHMVTIPTAMAIAEIATNQRVEGGGEYFIISRSFGLIIGGAIGIALCLSQAISFAFYIIAFAEAFRPVLDFLANRYELWHLDTRLLSVPAVFGISLLIIQRGASIGIQAIYVVAIVLFVSLAMFLLGGTSYEGQDGYKALVASVDDPEPFFLVFAIIFPAFTGMTAGVGLSGDLRDPKRSIPLGTLWATIIGMVVYIIIAYKLSISAPPDELVNNQLIMGKIATWSPIIPIGLVCASLSSALGCYLIAPRTMQAIASDEIIPVTSVNRWLASGRGKSNEPVNASVLTSAIALVFVLMGDVNFVAQIISMFFMVTYGSICLVSFLEHFAADPSYRPQFRSRWYISLFGAILSIWLMFEMSMTFAVIAIGTMFGLYWTISRYNEEKRGLSAIFQGAICQVSRQLQVFLQKSRKQEVDNWRPSMVAMSTATYQRLGAFDLTRWISERYGFGTYIHYIEGYLSKKTSAEADEAVQHMIRMAGQSSGNIYVDTIVSPSDTAAISQLIQLPGISGKDNNLVLFEFAKHDPSNLHGIVDNFPFVASMDFDVCILGSSDRSFGYRREIHVWLTPTDDENSNLMILLAYILHGHPDWEHAEIKIFSILSSDRMSEERDALHRLIRSGRFPIAEKNVETIPLEAGFRRRHIVSERSREADLVLMGFRQELLKRDGEDFFDGYEDVGNVLFVHSRREIDLTADFEETAQSEAGEEVSETSDPDSDVPQPPSALPQRNKDSSRNPPLP